MAGRIRVLERTRECHRLSARRSYHLKLPALVAQPRIAAILAPLAEPDAEAPAAVRARGCCAAGLAPAGYGQRGLDVGHAGPGQPSSSAGASAGSLAMGSAVRSVAVLMIAFSRSRAPLVSTSSAFCTSSLASTVSTASRV